MGQDLSLNDLYSIFNSDYYSIVDYIIGLQTADKLSDEKTEYKILKLGQSYLIRIKKENDTEINFFIYHQLEKIDIEGFNLTKTIDLKRIYNNMLEKRLDVDERNSTIIKDYFYISFNTILSFEDILNFLEITEIKI